MSYRLNFNSIWDNWELIEEGIYYAAVISLSAILLALVVGIIAAACRTSKFKGLNRIATIYIEVFRNTPLLVQLWLLYFGLAQIGIDISAVRCGILILGINSGAYMAEVIRAGLVSVDDGIIEAAKSLGFNPMQMLIKIKIPLALRAVLPSIGNNVVQCMLASSLLSNLGVNELTNQAMRLSSKTFRTFEAYIIVGVCYIALTFIFSLSIKLIGKSISKGSLH